MMGVRPVLVGAMVVMAMVTNASAQELLKQCQRIGVERKQFESQGGKLVVKRQPNLAAFSSDFLKGCQGYTRFGITILSDGSVSFGPDPKFYPYRDENPFEATKRCWFPLMDRIAEMRFEPAQLNGKPVCVYFDVWWKSSTPHELSRQP